MVTGPVTHRPQCLISAASDLATSQASPLVLPRISTATVLLSKLPGGPGPQYRACAHPVMCFIPEPGPRTISRSICGFAPTSFEHVAYRIRFRQEREGVPGDTKRGRPAKTAPSSEDLRSSDYRLTKVHDRVEPARESSLDVERSSGSGLSSMIHRSLTPGTLRWEGHHPGEVGDEPVPVGARDDQLESCAGNDVREIAWASLMYQSRCTIQVPD